tara:strand:- start:55 stop:300 length:246 start_codon:yes stop_codon:yes gene_type:complete
MTDLSFVDSIEFKFTFEKQEDADLHIDLYSHLIDDYNNSDDDSGYKADMDHWAYVHEGNISLIIVLTKLTNEEYKYKNDRN